MAQIIAGKLVVFLKRGCSVLLSTGDLYIPKPLEDAVSELS
jgi:hypothetical protein